MHSAASDPARSHEIEPTLQVSRVCTQTSFYGKRALPEAGAGIFPEDRVATSRPFRRAKGFRAEKESMLGPSCARYTHLGHSLLVGKVQRACICAHLHWRSHQTCQLSFVEGKERRKRPATDDLCSVVDKKGILRNW